MSALDRHLAKGIVVLFAENRKLISVGMLIDGALLVVLCLCLLLGVFATTQAPVPAALVDETATGEPTATETALPRLTPTMSLTPKPTATPTPFPTMSLVTPLPSLAIEEPTKLPYVFPTPLGIPGTRLPTPSRTSLPR
jgi:hypothetical protein